MNYSHGERLAFAKTFEEIIHADDIVHREEISYLQELKKHLDLDDVFLIKSRELGRDLQLEILNNMSEAKKKSFMNLVIKLAKSDGLIHLKECKLIIKLQESLGIYLEIQ